MKELLIIEKLERIARLNNVIAQLIIMSHTEVEQDQKEFDSLLERIERRLEHWRNH